MIFDFIFFFFISIVLLRNTKIIIAGPFMTPLKKQSIPIF